MARLEIEIAGNNTQLIAALKQSESAIKQFASTGGLGGAFKSSSPEIDKATQALIRQRTATEQFRSSAAKTRAELALLTLENRKNKPSLDGAVGSYREAQQRLAALGRAIRETTNGFNLNNPAVRAQVAEYNKLNNKLKEFDKAMGNNYRNVGNYRDAFMGAIPILGQFASAAGVASLAYQGLQKSFSVNLKMDALQTALKNVSGDLPNFVKNMDFLRATSERLGLEFVSTTEAFKQWQGAAKFSNLTTDESRQIFESVANAAAKMKLSTDQVQGAFLALSQMMSKGKVQAEELRGQLGERLPGAFALAAKAMGVTEAELNKMLETGKVVANDFLPKFAKQLDISFGNDKTEKITSMQASVNRLSNAFTELFQSEGATIFFTTITDGATDAIKSLNRLNDTISPSDFLGGMLGGGNRGIGSNVKGSLDNIIRQIYGYAGHASKKESVGFNPFGTNKAGVGLSSFIPESAIYSYKESTKAIDENSSAVVKNKQYWDDRVKSLRASIEAMDSSNIGTKEWNTTTAELNEALAKQKQFTNKGLFGVDRDAIAKAKELKETLASTARETLSAYDQKLFDINAKYEKIYGIVGKETKTGLLAQQNKEAELLKARIERVIDLTKQLKPAKVGLTGVSGEINRPSDLPNLAWNQWGINNRRSSSSTGNKDDEALEKRLGKIVERGMRQGISDIFGDIENLGSNFYEVFSNVFGKLSKSITGMFQNVLSTQLGDVLSKKINSEDFSIGGLGSNASKALIAGIGTAGSLISGMSSKKSYGGQIAGGALSGAAAGLAFGPYGAAVGAVIGAASGWFSASAANKRDKIQEQQLAEQRKSVALQERQNALSYTASITGQASSSGIVTGVDRNAFGDIVFRVAGRELVGVMTNEENAQKRGL